MPFRSISRDLKFAALNLYASDLLSLEDILACVGFSRSTFFRICKLWCTTGDVIRPRSCNRGRPRLLHFDDLQYLLRLIQHRPDWFLDEFLSLLKTNRFISVHYTTIHRELERLGMSTKRLKVIAVERKEPLRNDFLRRMANYTPEQLGFLDETSKNEKTIARRNGRAKIGQRAEMRQPFVCSVCLSAEGLLTINGIIVSRVVEGSMKRVQFIDFLEHEVVSSFLLHVTSLILCTDANDNTLSRTFECAGHDNARIHHGAEILKLCECFGMFFSLVIRYII